jgi:hypothetical protein
MIDVTGGSEFSTTAVDKAFSIANRLRFVRDVDVLLILGNEEESRDGKPHGSE